MDDSRIDREQPDPRVEPTVELTVASLAWEVDDATRAVIRERVATHLQLADALRAFSLANADEPDFVFAPYRAEG